ncbi:hypothetical protein D1BOALGB6SA_10903 [Olavius sp. associated proteobacterium Delta 1]|nr:hypothetical protein D1BOALGB6SA_10903 [Olavius sp. associated proteobacterium Delta 1]
MRFVGLPGEAALAVVTGMLFNFYAALGIILALGLSAWQITIMAVILSCCHELVLVFLGICHSIIEDTVVFIALGANWWVLIGARFLIAAFAAFTVSFLMRPMPGAVTIKPK